MEVLASYFYHKTIIMGFRLLCLRSKSRRFHYTLLHGSLKFPVTAFCDDPLRTGTDSIIAKQIAYVTCYIVD